MRKQFSWAAALWPALAFAAPSAHEQLKATEAAIARENAHKHELSEQAAHLQEELQNVQRQLVKKAREQQETERALLQSEAKIAELRQQQEEKATALQQSRAHLSTMVSAAIRLSQTPPQAALLMPGDLQNTLEAARVLSSLTVSIKRESENLNAQVKALDEVQARLRESRDKQTFQQKQLKAEQAELAGRINERKTLVAKLAQEESAISAHLSDLNRKAGNLKDLIATIEKRRKAETLRKPSPLEQAQENQLRAPRGKGQMESPVAGSVVHRFGERLGRNETSKGITLAAREGAQVVAPFDGEVVFTGPFLDYGRLVILRHRDDFHTLLAGLARIDVTVGQFLLEGEPIGAMGESPSSRDLYLELRQHNQPVDPAEWINL